MSARRRINPRSATIGYISRPNTEERQNIFSTFVIQSAAVPGWTFFKCSTNAKAVDVVLIPKET